jgi:N-acyl-D-aspartate/D-glutamate deacylase
MWHEYREKHPGGTVIHHYNKEEWTSVATNAPDVIVAADGFPIFTLEQKVAPFGIGTNARVLGRYVREKSSLSLQDAIAKMTYLPAKMLQGYSPSMAMKGRIKVGADADITVFDAADYRQCNVWRPVPGIQRYHPCVGGRPARDQ